MSLSHEAWCLGCRGKEAQAPRDQGTGGSWAHLARMSYSEAAGPASKDMRTRAFSEVSGTARARLERLLFFGICKGGESLSLFLPPSSPL